MLHSLDKCIIWVRTIVFSEPQECVLEVVQEAPGHDATVKVSSKSYFISTDILSIFYVERFVPTILKFSHNLTVFVLIFIFPKIFPD